MHKHGKHDKVLGLAAILIVLFALYEWYKKGGLAGKSGSGKGGYLPPSLGGNLAAGAQPRGACARKAGGDLQYAKNTQSVVNRPAYRLTYNPWDLTDWVRSMGSTAPAPGGKVQ